MHHHPSTARCLACCGQYSVLGPKSLQPLGRALWNARMPSDRPVDRPSRLCRARNPFPQSKPRGFLPTGEDFARSSAHHSVAWPFHCRLAAGWQLCGRRTGPSGVIIPLLPYYRRLLGGEHRSGRDEDGQRSIGIVYSVLRRRTGEESSVT